MKAIFTKYHGPTNTRGSRISAQDEDGNRVTISYPYQLSGEAVHRKAADALLAKMNWKGNLIGGSVRNGYVFVFGPTAELIYALELAETTIKRLDKNHSAVGTLDVIRKTLQEAR